VYKGPNCQNLLSPPSEQLGDSGSGSG
jgi:hypothetical protein